MKGQDARWQVWVAPSRLILERRLAPQVAKEAPGEAVVVVRSAQDEKRLARVLGPGCQVTRLGRFLGRSGPYQIEDEDLLPDSVPQWFVEAALPGGYQSAPRQHLASVFLEAIHLLEENAIRPPYPGRSRVDAEDHLEKAHRALLEGLAGHHEAGRFARFERVSLSRMGGSRLRVAFPAVRRVLFFGIDRLSPAEREAVRNVVPEDVEVEWFVVGARSRGEHAGLWLTRPLVEWLQESGSVQVVEPEEEEEGKAGSAQRVAALAPLFSMRPQRPGRLEGVWLDTPRPAGSNGDKHNHGAWGAPRDRVAEVHRLLARIRKLLEEGVEPHEVGVVVPALADYHGLLEDLFSEYGVPVALSYRGALRTSPPGSFLSALLDAMDSNLARDAVLDLLAHPLCAFPAKPMDEADEPVGPLRADRLRIWLLESGWNPRGREGPGGWSKALRSICREKQSKSDSDGDSSSAKGRALAFRRAQAGGLADVLDRLDALASESDPVALIEGIRAAMDAARMRERVIRASRASTDAAYLLAAHRGVVELLDTVEDAFRLGGPQRSGVRSVREVLRRLLAQKEVPLPVDPDVGVQVLAWRSAAERSFRHVFVIGATQDALPEKEESVAVEELVRERFKDSLEQLDRAAEARRILHGILADTHGTVVFSSPQSQGEAPLVRSVLLDELAECFQVPFTDPVQGAVYTKREAMRRAVGENRPLAEPPEHAGPALSLLRERARGTSPGVYTGRIMDERVRSLPAFARVVGRGGVSAGRLSDFAKCPFKAMVVNGLYVRAPWERDEELDPRDKGGILHDVLERYMREAIRLSGPPFRLRETERKQHEALLLKVALEVVAENRRRSIAFQAFEHALLGGLPGGSNPYSGIAPGLLVRFLDELQRFDDGEGVLAVEVGFQPASQAHPGASAEAMQAGTPTPSRSIHDEGRAGDAHGTSDMGEMSDTGDSGDMDNEGDRDREVVLGTPVGPVHLRGRIDRLDRLRGDDGGYTLRVVEYKSGRVPPKELVRGGVEFQLPLYALAAGLLEPEHPVEQAVYHQMKRPRRSEAGIVWAGSFTRGGKNDLEGLLDETPRRLGEILSAQRDGVFPLTLLDENEAGCDWCELRRGCGLRPEVTGLRRERARAMKHKSGDAGVGYVPDRVDLPVDLDEGGPAEGGGHRGG